MDQIGPLSTSVADAALLMDVLAGPDAKDSTSAAMAFESFSSALTGDLRGARIGVPRSVVAQGTDAGVLACGQVVGLLDDLPTCEELIDRVVTEAAERATATAALRQ